MSHKAENTITKEKMKVWIGQSPTRGSALCVGTFAARTLCATEHSLEHNCRLVHPVCRSPHRAKEFIKIQGQPSHSARVQRAGFNARRRADENRDEQKADAFQQEGN